MESTINGRICSPRESVCWSLEKVLDESQLTGELHLSGRSLTDYPELASNCRMEDTIFADLSRNRLLEIPCDVCDYRSIEWLNCYGNLIKYIPNTIVQLHHLVYLNISRNQLSVIPPCLCQLTQLQVLLASHNRLSWLPDEINQLGCLMELDVSCNEIAQLPEVWNGLQSLKSLNVRRNQLADLPSGLSCLQLICLNVSCNSISRLPVEYHQLTTLEIFCLEFNPIEFPPQQVCMKGREHVMKFLATEAARSRQRSINSRAKYRRPLGLSSARIQKNSQSCDNVEQFYISCHRLESGYCTSDSSEKLRLSNSEDVSVKVSSANSEYLLQLDLNECNSVEENETDSLASSRIVEFSARSPVIHTVPFTDANCEDDGGFDVKETEMHDSMSEKSHSPVQFDIPVDDDCIQILCQELCAEGQKLDTNETATNAERLALLRSLLESSINKTLPDDLGLSLRNGVILCQMVNMLRPNSVRDICVPSDELELTPEQCRNNVKKFLQACRYMGLDEGLICSCEDVSNVDDCPQRLLTTVQHLLAYRQLTLTDYIISVFCVVAFCIASLLLAWFPLPN